MQPETPGLALESGELDVVGRRRHPGLDAQQLAHPPHRQLCGQRSEESGLDWSGGGREGGVREEEGVRGGVRGGEAAAAA